MTPREQEQMARYRDALREIAAYMEPRTLRRKAEKLYGLAPEEAIEYAYDNVLATAKAALRSPRAVAPELKP